MILTCVIRSYVGMPSIMREVDECHATKNFDFANYFGIYTLYMYYFYLFHC